MPGTVHPLSTASDWMQLRLSVNGGSDPKAGDTAAVVFNGIVREESVEVNTLYSGMIGVVSGWNRAI